MRLGLSVGHIFRGTQEQPNLMPCLETGGTIPRARWSFALLVSKLVHVGWTVEEG